MIREAEYDGEKGIVRSVEGKMTDLTEQMVACWMSAWRITTLAPKGHRVRWLSRFHCRSLALPRVWYCHSQLGRIVAKVWPKGEPTIHGLLDTWPHPVTDCKSCKSCTIQGSTTGSYYGATTGPAEPELLRSFFGPFFAGRWSQSLKPFL